MTANDRNEMSTSTTASWTAFLTTYLSMEGLSFGGEPSAFAQRARLRYEALSYASLMAANCENSGMIGEASRPLTSLRDTMT